jgi:CRISPR-associated protein Cmr4
MFRSTKPLFLIVETPLHAGSGDSLGIVDLPIQRERHTSFPKIEASSLKGALREVFEEKFESDLSNVTIGFGPEEGDAHAGALGFTDARLLLFPVKSMKGIFAWITCPMVLDQFKKDMALAGEPIDIDIEEPNDGQCFVLNNGTNLKVGNDHILLEEYAFKVSYKNSKINGTEQLEDWLANRLCTEGSMWKSKMQKDIVVLRNDDFKDFVNLTTEVITRIKINNETGTVQQGALFTEEYLPSESIMYAIILASPEFSDKKGKLDADAVMKFFDNNLPDAVQVGGNATLGKGIVKTIISKSA